MTDIVTIQPAETAALFNIGKSCRLRLWRKKRGQVADYPAENDLATLNELARAHFTARYEELTGRQRRFGVEGDVFLLRNEGPLLRHGSLVVRPVSKESFRQTKRNGLSEEQIIELHAAMLATEATWGSYAVGSRDSGELLHFDVDRDQWICDAITKQIGPFIAQVENGPAPDMLEPDDHRCQDCEYRLSCQGAALLALEECTENDESLKPFIDAYQAEQQKVKDAEDVLLEARDALEQRMGNRTQVFCGKKRVDWKVQERMVQDVKELIATYEKLRKEFIEVIGEARWQQRDRHYFPPAETMKKVSVSRPLRIWG